jgi:nitrogen regulatory protein P-II 1
MKAIIAYIKPHKLCAVTLALHRIQGLTGMTVSEVQGFGRGRMGNHSCEGADGKSDFSPHSKIEIYCPDELVDDIVESIRTAAHTGLRGDGKIYVNAGVENAVRISTGDSGGVAV